MIRHYCEMSHAEIDSSRMQFTKWTADLLADENRLVLNCYYLGDNLYIWDPSFFCDCWPSFNMSTVLNGLECRMGHRHGLLVSSGGIYVHNPGNPPLDYLSPRSTIRLFVNGSPKGCVIGHEFKGMFDKAENVEMWITDPRLQFAAYAMLLERSEKFVPLLNSLPKVEDAIMFLRHYDLYQPRLDFSQDFHGLDPYQNLHFVCKGLEDFGTGIFDALREGV